MTQLSERFEKFGPYLVDMALILAAVLGCYARYAFTGVTFPGLPGAIFTDMLLQTASNMTLTGESLARGELPLWNPYIYMGIPHFALGFTGVLYLLNVIYAFGPFEVLVKYDFLFHTWLMGVFTYLLVRDAGGNRPASLFAVGIALFTSPTIITFYGGHVSLMHTLAYVPLALWCLRRVLASGSLGWTLGFSAVVCVQIFAGYAQLVVYELVGFGLYTVADLARLRMGAREPFGVIARKGALLLGGVVLGLALAAVQLLLTQELFATESVRSAGVSPDLSSLGSMAPKNLWHALTWRPEAMTDVVPGFPVLPFVGPFSIALAALAMIRRKSSEVWVIALLAGFCFVYQLGNYLAAFGIVSKLPIVGTARGPIRMLFIFPFYFALLTGLGATRFLEALKEPATALRDLRWFLVGLVVLLAIPILSDPMRPATALALVLSLGAYGAIRMKVRAGAAAIGWLALCLAFEVYRSFAFAPQLFAEPGEYEIPEDFAAFAEAHPGYDRIALFSGVGPDKFRLTDTVGMRTQRRFLHGYGAGILLNYEKAVSNLVGMEYITRDEAGLFVRDEHYEYFGRDWVTPEALPYFDLLNVRYFLTTRKSLKALDAHGGYPKSKFGDLTVYENPNAYPVAYLVHEVRVEPDEDAMFAAMKSLDVDLRETVFLAGDVTPPVLEPAAGSESVAVVSYEAGAVGLRVYVTAPALLVLTDTFYPGWVATVNGSEWRGLYKANGFFRGVEVKPGDTTVRFEYRPRRLRQGRIVSMGGMVVWVVLALLVAGRRRRT